MEIDEGGRYVVEERAAERRWSFLIGICVFSLNSQSVLLPVTSITSFLFLKSINTLGFRCFVCTENP